MTMGQNAVLAYQYAKEISKSSPRQLDRIVDMFSKVAEIAHAFPQTVMTDKGISCDVEYLCYREIARARRKMNEIGSGYHFDMKNYHESARYYHKAFELAATPEEKLTSLDGEASCYWNLGNKQKWCDVKEQQIDYISEKDRLKTVLEIAREQKNEERKNNLLRLVKV